VNLRLLKSLIFDLDGVVWRGETPIPGAANAIARFRELGIRPFFATNNSSREAQFFADKLTAAGITASPEEVVTSSTATALYISRNLPSGVSVFVVGEVGIVRFLEKIGAKVFTESDFAEGTAVPDRVDCVVAGIDREFTYAKLKRAQGYILGGAQFIATNRDATFPIEGGVVPGSGSIVSSIETASGVVPLSMGKPAPAMLELILETCGLQKHEAAMIGDRLDTDIACAHNAGIGKIFVATGVDSMQTALAAQGEFKADLFLNDLGELVNLINQHHS
jgi:4-nitrophenyl phosphatase